MKLKSCPICQGEHFYGVDLVSYHTLRVQLGFFNQIPVQVTVCLSCGFVAPSVDHNGVVAIREKARKEGIVIDEKPGTEELRER